MVLVGISYWMAEKELLTIKPPNAYTGPAAWISQKVTKHNLISVLLLLAGLTLIGLFGFRIVRGLI